MSKDSVLEKIFDQFDTADEAFKKDVNNNIYQNLYATLEERTKNNEFTKEQILEIVTRSKQSQDLFLELKQKKITEMSDLQQNTQNISTYVKNSSLVKKGR